MVAYPLKMNLLSRKPPQEIANILKTFNTTFFRRCRSKNRREWCHF